MYLMLHIFSNISKLQINLTIILIERINQPLTPYTSNESSPIGSTGGTGGGIIHLEARRVLNDGSIRANAGDASGFGAGGGSGGSIYVICEDLDGTLTGKWLWATMCLRRF